MQKRKNISVIAYLIVGFSVIFSFLNPHLINAESQIIKLEEIKNSSADTANYKFVLTAEKDQYDTSKIEIIDDVVVENMEDLPKGIQYDKETQTIQIDWSTLPEEKELEIPVKLVNKDSAEIEVLTVDNDNKEIKETILLPTNQSNSDSSSSYESQSSSVSNSSKRVSSDEYSNSSNVETSHTSDSSDTSSGKSSAKEENTSSSYSDNIDNSEVSIVEKKREENAVSSESKESDDIKSTSNFSISSSNHSSNNEMDISTTNKVDSKIIEKQSTGMQVAQSQGTTVTVSSWNSFVDAMKSGEVGQINISKNFSTGLGWFDKKDKEVGRNKIINGNGYTIGFDDYGFNIKNYQIKVNNLFAKVDQGTEYNASIFFSSNGGDLRINNVSFIDGSEGQVAQLPSGKIIISGSNSFSTKGAYEIFEANHIIFSFNSTLFAENTSRPIFDSDVMEVINLYGASIIDIQNNADVTLQTEVRNSVINSLSDQSTQINIGENAALNVSGKDVNTRNGQPLINLPVQGSSINLDENAELNVENKRVSSNIPEDLISMNGNINMHPSGNQVEYWQMAADYQQYAGQHYVKFPSILDGKINFNGGTIRSASMSPQSSLSISENSSRNNKMFSELLSNINSIGRLRITKAEAPKQPEAERLTDLDVELKGKASPGLTIHISDNFGNSWETLADSDTGDFSIDLGDFAPYNPGDQFTVTAADSYGNTSDPITITVVGNRLSFRVPTQMNFEQTVIQDELVTIPRTNKNWGIEVTNTRQNNNPWRVTAQAQSPLTTVDGQDTIDNALVFINENNNQSLNNEVLVYEENSKDNVETTIHWSDNQGVLLQLNPQAEQVQTYKTYKATIDWTLTDAP